MLKIRMRSGFGPFLACTSMLLPFLWSPAAGGVGVHSGGVGACENCHIMHDTESGMGQSNPLIIGNNPSDLCLSCHAANFGSVMGADPLAPPPETGAGNFIFLLEDNLNDGTDGLINPIPGDAAGHNIHAPAYGLSQDPTFAMSPGGNYPSHQMKCTSCHDPHGNGSYRFLRGVENQPGGQRFMYPAPDAEGLDLLIGTSESNNNHVAYRGGMSEWCANCHADYFNDDHRGVSSFEHPSDRNLESGIANRYNAYNGTLDPAGGSAGTAYLAEVPFEDPFNSTGGTLGPSPSSRVMCLTCHRAHASSAPHAGRWDFNIATLGQDGLVSGSYPIPNPYGDPNQDHLCYKCHEGGTD